MLTKDGISPNMPTSWIAISLVAFILIYAIVATVDLLLMLKYSREEPPAPRAPVEVDEPVPALQY
jgi:cytochrome d ubiquinol oxidase subunit I